MKINDETKRVVERPHLKRNQEVRILSDASKHGLGAVLQQSHIHGEWKRICFASVFLPIFDAKFSIIELKISAIIEYMRGCTV